MKNIKLLNLSLAVILLMTVFTACSDDKDTDDNLVLPEFREGAYIIDVTNLSYFNLKDGNSLYPVFILQAEGFKRMYPNSPFAQEYITEDMRMVMSNPGIGTQITLTMGESEVCKTSTYSYTVEDDKTEEGLYLQIPVEWDYKALRTWMLDRNVNLTWTVELNGKKVQTFKKQFICRSIHNYVAELELSKNVPEEMKEINAMKNVGLGDFSYKEDDDTFLLYTGDLIAGYIDENSPLIDKLKAEALADGYLPYFTGAASSNAEEMLQSVDAYCYLMQKYNICYAMRNASADQYVRTIDEIFKNRQGYCLELACAFVSWCLNLGIQCSCEFVPGHATTSVYFGDNSENSPLVKFPFDTTIPASIMSDRTRFSIPPTSEEFKRSHSFYEMIKEYSELSDEKYEIDKVENPILYFTVNPAALRTYLPSFNMGGEAVYLKTRVTSTTKCIKPITISTWK